MTAIPAKTPPPKAHHISPAISLLLDVLRFSAALAVVVNHACFQRYNFGLPVSQIGSILGDLAVPVFFVLSGFIIRYVTRTREVTLRAYSINRLSRIYSTVLPAIAVTIAIVVACYFLNPALFVWDLHSGMNSLALRFAANVLFFSQFWGHSIIPFDNIPFWSLGYECPYYVIYALIYFLRGWKRIVTVLIFSLLAGPQVLLLLPIWWAGCWLYDLYSRIRGTRSARILATLLPLWLIAGGLLAALRRPQVLLAPIHLLQYVATLPNPIVLAGFPERKASMAFFAIGIGTFAVLFFLLLLVDPIHLHPHNRWLRRVRHVADGTFLVYLLHYPMLTLALYLGLFHPHRYLQDALVVTVIVFLLVLLARPTDLLKVRMRIWLHTHLPIGPSDSEPA